MPPRAQHLEPSSLLTSAVLDRLFESIQEGLYIGTVNLDGDTTIVANPHLKLMLGHPPEADAKAVRPFEPERFVDPDARAAFVERLIRDGSVADYLLRLRRADDSLIWTEVTACLDSSKGNPQQVLALIRDISERRRLEEQGRNIYQQVLQSEKMAALGQTVSGVAHELNNPLATILTWSERLSLRDLDDVAKRGIQTILSESERAAKIVRNLLTFSRKRHTTRALIELNQIVRETLLLRAYDQRVSNIRTVEALAAGLPPVFADPHQIKQVLLNLFVNAEQAMLSANGRGTIIIRTWYDADQETVILEVNDDGPGVPDQVQAKLFEPFFTTKSVGQGTGLGLTVAYAIVQEHGGHIRITSEKGKGASFFVEFPLTTTTSQKAARPKKNEGATGHGARVLVAEDESALSTAVSEALVDAGFRVDCARDGQEALDRIKAETYDLLICDLKMPRMDGPTLHRLLTQIKPTLAHRTIFVTGDVAEEENERFLEESGCHWLAKPFRLNDLLAFANDVVSQLPRRN